ncbi:MAG: hypothetical protein ACI9K5_003702, partial [Gammaproteobacteria bacterium]
KKPSRIALRPLVGTGGFSVDSSELNSLEASLDSVSKDAGIPGRQEFKWSPGRNLWMRDGLVGDDRVRFFERIIATLADHGASATVVASETDCAQATDASSPELDVTTLFLERAHNQLLSEATSGVVIVDRPGGGRKDEDKFLSDCVTAAECTSTYVRPQSFAVNVLCGSSDHVRCLQAADVIASCSLAFIAGESQFSPGVFAAIRPLLRRNSLGFVGGTGLKLHPDMRLMNLYHWVAGDESYARGMSGISLPSLAYNYYEDNGMPTTSF